MQDGAIMKNMYSTIPLRIKLLSNMCGSVYILYFISNKPALMIYDFSMLFNRISNCLRSVMVNAFDF